MWTENEFINEVSAKTDLPLNTDQQKALAKIYEFLFKGGTQSAFILRGYAGTGKTTLMGCLIRWFHSINRKTVLLAPTGRSAKVLSAHSGFPASTIHRRIYAVKDDGGGRMSMQLMENKSERTLFLVDEASMIGDASQNESGFGRSLIHDLVEYVYSGEKCRLILIGDEAQLPPVGMELSPALNQKELSPILGGPVFESTLKSVVRQASDSLILSNATDIRNSIAVADFNLLNIKTNSKGDVQIVEPDDLEDALTDAFSSDDNRAVMVCRSNKDAYQFNQQIRVRIFDREEILEAGDRIMIVKNNYHWKIPGRRQNFLANGDMVMVDRVFGISEFGEFRFAECLVRLVDEEVDSFHLIVLLNTIDFEGPSIPPKQMKALREAMIKCGALDEAEDVARFFQNPYFNAAQVKYAYAVTCHKSQGGQWEDVFVYQGYLTEEMLDKSYFRWLYTAITRAKHQLYLVGFHPNFLE